VIPWKRSSWGKNDIEELLRANSLESGNYGYVNVYALAPDGKHLQEPHLIGFSRVFSIRMQEMDTVLKKKVLQLDDVHRAELQGKLAYFYARPAE